MVRLVYGRSMCLDSKEININYYVFYLVLIFLLIILNFIKFIWNIMFFFI